MEFEEFKQIVLDTIDESSNLNELVKNVVNKVYQKGIDDSKKIGST